MLCARQELLFCASLGKFKDATAPTGYWSKVRWIIRSLITLSVIWFCGFLIFAQSLPDAVLMPKAPTDAIVVLTGGSLRLETGLELLANKRAKKLFVSEFIVVLICNNCSIWLRDRQAVSCCIALGYDADNTVVMR